MSGDREHLRTTFDSAADLYQRARPEYPGRALRRLIEAAGLERRRSVAGVGCGTGKATLPLARRGFRITCVELGPALAARPGGTWRTSLRWRSIEGAFETLDTAAADRVRPRVRGHRLALARPGDPLPARMGSSSDRPGTSPSGAPPTSSRPAGTRSSPSCRRCTTRSARASRGTRSPQPGELPDRREEIERSGLFGEVVVRHFDWEVAYDADQYIRLLDTFSGHIAMETWQRDRLYSEIRRRLSERADGRLRRGWGAVLHIARRLGGPTRFEAPRVA